MSYSYIVLFDLSAERVYSDWLASKYLQFIEDLLMKNRNPSSGFGY